MNVMFIGAHPDDIESQCGGTAALYAKKGANVYFCVFTNGNIGSSTLTKDEIRDIRHAEAIKAAATIDATLIWLDFDDEFLFDTKETRLAFIDAMRQADPDVLFCHWTYDYNPDHSISSKIVDDCAHMASIPLIKTDHPPIGKIPHVYYMDAFSGIGFEPLVYVDITETFETKIAMLKCHASQDQWMIDMYGIPLTQVMEIPAKYRGMQAGCRYAEGFRPSHRIGRTFTENYLPNSLDVVQYQQ